MNANRSDSTLIFIPALGTTRDVWWRQIEHFAPTYRLETFSGPGHDTTYGPTPDLDLFADALHAFLEQRAVRAVTLIGISMGGMIAQIYAARHPRPVEALILVSTAATYPDAAREALRARAEVVERDGMQPLIEPTLDRWFTPGFRHRDRQAVDRVRGMLDTCLPAAYAGAARAVAAVENRALLARIEAPTLIVSGSEDASLPPDAVSILEKGIPHSRTELVAGAAHLCNIERAETFNDVVSTFLLRAARVNLD